ncbi:MAG: hypothetical protein V3V14_05635 [Saprospiraceae bacterium]
MKKKIFTLLAFSMITFASFGQINFGVGATYFNDLGVQARAAFDAGSFEVVPKATYFFTKGVTVLEIDADVHFNVAEIAENPVYVLGGLGYHILSSSFASTSNLGINAGAGVRISNIFVEVKYAKILCENCGGDIAFTGGYMF